MGLIVLIGVSIFSCWRWGDWKNWKLYYPTILYIIVGDLACNILTYDKPLWSYNIPPFNHSLVNLFVMLFIYPCTVILFLSHYPEKIYRQLIHVSLWVFVYISIECAVYFMGGYIYNNGWNLGWSFLLDSIMFPLLYFHYKKPLWVWPISIATAFAVSLIFKIPINSLR